MESMNEHHLPLTEWALSRLEGVEPGGVLDVGCGGGLALSLAAQRWPKASLYGADVSASALEFCFERNRELVNSGRMELVQAPAGSLPYRSGSFDLVISVESYFFWEDLAAGIAELGRVTAPGGTLMIVSEAYPHPDFDDRNKENSRLHGFTLVDPEGIADLIAIEGFETEVHLVEEMNWMAVIGDRMGGV